MRHNRYRSVPDIVNKLTDSRDDCKNVENEIPLFLSDKIEPEEMTGFLDHVDHCESCMEELTIQFLVRIGMKKLEAGDNFHLGQELKAVLDTRRRELVCIRRLSAVSVMLQVIAIIMTAVCIAAGVIMLL